MPTLITMAVPDEAGPYLRRVRARADGEFRGLLPRRSRLWKVPAGWVLVTGMGRANTRNAVTAFLQRACPDRIVTAGFAGGLHPELASGTVLFEGGEGVVDGDALERLGARRARFATRDRVMVTVEEKVALFRETGADAVEMESIEVHAVAGSLGIPSVTLRVISDAADEALPLDFNRWMGPEGDLDLAGMLLHIATRPGLVPGLIRFQRVVRRAADSLATVLLAYAGPGDV